jgi:hypothetical protein
MGSLLLNFFLLNRLGSVKDLNLKRLPFCGKVDDDPLGDISGVYRLCFPKLNGQNVSIGGVCDPHMSRLPENSILHRDSTP